MFGNIAPAKIICCEDKCPCCGSNIIRCSTCAVRAVMTASCFHLSLPVVYAILSRDEVAEWLRRWTANPMGSARVSSNLILVEPSLLLLYVVACTDARRDLCHTCRCCFNVTASIAQWLEHQSSMSLDSSKLGVESSILSGGTRYKFLLPSTMPYSTSLPRPVLLGCIVIIIFIIIIIIIQNDSAQDRTGDLLRVRQM